MTLPVHLLHSEGQSCTHNEPDVCRSAGGAQNVPQSGCQYAHNRLISLSRKLCVAPPIISSIPGDATAICGWESKTALMALLSLGGYDGPPLPPSPTAMLASAAVC